jgi:benzoylformate decarboxylase
VSAISRVAATRESVAAARDVLAAGDSVLILAGDGVGHADAWAELADVAERLGAEVVTEAHATTWNFPVDHPLSGGAMSSQAAVMRRRLEEADTLLMVGVTSQAPVSRFDGGAPLVPWRLRVVAIDDSSWELGKNEPIEVGLLGDVGTNLRLLAQELRERPIDDAELSARLAATTERNEARRRREAEARAGRPPSDELTVEDVAATVAELLPKDFVLVDEAISNRAAFTSVVPFAAPSSYVGANGISLGHSTGTASGVHLAGGAAKVVNIVGDGSLLYYPQALWSAANTGAAIVVVVLNNRGYRVLKLITARIREASMVEAAPVPGLDLDAPEVDLVKLAEAFGVRGVRATTPEEFHRAFAEAVRAPVPVLIDAQIHQGAGASAG